MRLLHRNGGDIELVEFLGKSPPPYAILSHRWGLPNDEVTFQDINERIGYYRLKPGYAKVAFCIDQAEADGLQYCWVDTCCIDKANNTELSEAIHSMFRWYGEAAKCYAYLSDVPELPFESSQWFNRGWTLQELLAPEVVEFYSSKYELLGTKESLIEKIQHVTEIPLEALQCCPLSRFSVEEKFSWTNRRQTQRPEDMAYCLHGIFDIYMPLLYGEGRKRALLRLHRQIQQEMGLGDADSSWQQALDTERVLRAVVRIQYCRTRVFNTEEQDVGEGSGIVVDAKRGYILTSRQVVGFAPTWAVAIFSNYEECDVYPVYRDPIHDFGILRFSPTSIKHLVLEQLSLRPDQAKVGVKVRIIGVKPAGDVRIMAADITRVDLNSPEVVPGSNMNYIQSTTDAHNTGGPVVNNDGHAVAIRPGANRGRGFLPLDRPLRALQCLSNDQPISRGTIQTRWLLKSLAQCRRLGLDQNTEMRIRKRFPKDISMLIVSTVVPEGPSDQKLYTGDILVEVNGELLIHFVRFEEIMDSNVGGTISLTICRGGNVIGLELRVDDLHALTPDRYVNVAGSHFQRMPFHEADRFGVAARGVYVCLAEGSFSRRFLGCVIESINQEETPDLETFIEVVSRIPHNSQVVVKSWSLHSPTKLMTSLIRFQRELATSMQLAVRNDITGFWDFTVLTETDASVVPQRESGRIVQFETAQYPAAAELVRSFASVSCEPLGCIEGFYTGTTHGYGLIVDAEQGLVVVSRSVVIHDFCRIRVAIAESIKIDAKVVFLHPNANYAVLQYDPKLVDAPVKSARLSMRYMEQGDSTIFIGQSSDFNDFEHGRTTVRAITTCSDKRSSVPRYHAFNLEAISIDFATSSHCSHGALVTEDGTVEALWLQYTGGDSFYTFGMATPTLALIVNQIREGITPKIRILDTELSAIRMYQARLLGVPQQWIDHIMEASPSHTDLLIVRKTSLPLDAEHGSHSLLEDDIILTIEEKLITRPRDLDLFHDRETLEVRVVRDGKEMVIQVGTVSNEDWCTDYILEFCGATLHQPHRDVRQDMSRLHSKIYISSTLRGSPSDFYQFDVGSFITAINDKRVETLEDLKAEALKIPDNTYFRIVLTSLATDTQPWVTTAKKNEHYFPMYEYVRQSLGVWTKRKVESQGQKAEVLASTVPEAGNNKADLVLRPRATSISQ